MLQQPALGVDTNQFKTVGINHVESLRGFSVRRKDKNCLLYTRPGLILEMEVEPGESLGVYLTYSAKTQGIGDLELQAIRTDLSEALQFMNVEFELH